MVIPLLFSWLRRNQWQILLISWLASNSTSSDADDLICIKFSCIFKSHLLLSIALYTLIFFMMDVPVNVLDLGCVFQVIINVQLLGSFASVVLEFFHFLRDPSFWEVFVRGWGFLGDVDLRVRGVCGEVGPGGWRNLSRRLFCFLLIFYMYASSSDLFRF